MIKSKNSIITQGYKQRKNRLIGVTILLAALTLCLCTMMLIYGNTKYPLDVVIKVLSGENVKGATFAIETLQFTKNALCFISWYGFWYCRKHIPNNA